MTKRYVHDTLAPLVAAAGFDVYMRTPDDTWLIYTDGKRLANLQKAHFGGFQRSTVHVPNTTTGTGFALDHPGGRGEEELTREALEEGFATAPSWANSRDVASVRKFASPATYFKGFFNRDYKLTHARAGNEVRYAKALARKQGALGVSEEMIFACSVKVTGSHHALLDDLVSAINAQGFEVVRVLDHSLSRDCVL